MAAPMRGGASMIRFIDGPLAGQTVALNKPQLMLGREPTNDIAINEPTVSRQHARLTQGPHGWTLEKINPNNTLRVNGRDVTQSALNNGDTVLLGPISFQFMEMAAAPAAV